MSQYGSRDHFELNLSSKENVTCIFCEARRDRSDNVLQKQMQDKGNYQR
jgi:hypothetical protein